MVSEQVPYSINSFDLGCRFNPNESSPLSPVPIPFLLVRVLVVAFETEFAGLCFALRRLPVQRTRSMHIPWSETHSAETCSDPVNVVTGDTYE